MEKKIKIFDISIDEKIYNFVNDEVLHEINLNKKFFWKDASILINEFNKINKDLLDKRIFFQNEIDDCVYIQEFLPCDHPKNILVHCIHNQ